MATEKIKKRWKCKYCDGINSRKDLYCVSCGARWSDVTKEPYVEEMQKVEEYTYPDEEQQENFLNEEHAEIECEQKNLSSSNNSFFDSFHNEEIFFNTIKRVMIAAVLLPLMIMCLSYLFNTVEGAVEELASTVEDMESMNTYSEEVDEQEAGL